MRRILACVVLVLAFAISAEATTYYVRTDGSNSNAGTSNTAGGAWLTIDFAADNASVTSDDVIRVQAGHYGVIATPTRNGTAGHPVTIVADGGASACGFSFSGQSYIRIVGFTLDGTLASCTTGTRINASGTNTGLEFWNNSLDHSETDDGISFDAAVRCNACIFIGNSVHHVGNGSGGTVTAGAFQISGNDVFAGYMDIATVCYLGVQPSGARQRFVNVNFDGMIQCNGAHPDFYYPQGLNSFGFSDNLIEATFGIGTPTSNDNKFQHAQNETGGVSWDDNVWRFNVSHMLGSAPLFSMYNTSGALNLWKYYNNSMIYGQEATATATCGNVSIGSPIFIVNNGFYRCWADATASNAAGWDESGGTFTKDYNGYFDDGVPAMTYQASVTNQAHEVTNVDPQLNNVASDQFWIGSGSSAGTGWRGTGGPLTTATSCSGTTLNVASNTGSFFIGDNSANLPAYNGALVQGDFLTINSTTYQVVSRSTDALTLNTSLTCANGDAVYFGTSSTIDIGAFPYKAGGYTLSATYANSGGTVTITPNDATLVRFVVCYDSDIPIAIDNTSPYTCTAGSGTFSARVYPLYANPVATLWTQATDAGTTPDRRRFRFFRRRGAALDDMGFVLAVLFVRRRWKETR